MVRFLVLLFPLVLLCLHYPPNSRLRNVRGSQGVWIHPTEPRNGLSAQEGTSELYRWEQEGISHHYPGRTSLFRPFSRGPAKLTFRRRQLVTKGEGTGGDLLMSEFLSLDSSST